MKGMMNVLILLLLTNVTYALDQIKLAHNKADYVQAINLLKQESKNSNPEAQYYLGLMYTNGQGEPRDDKKAVYWFKKSAEQGFVKAQYALGHMYAYSDKLEHDYDQAIVWFKKAQSQGYEEAAYDIKKLSTQQNASLLSNH